MAGVKTRPSLMPDAAQPLRAPAAPVKKGPAEPLRWFRVSGGPTNHNVPGGIGPFRRNQGDYFLKLGQEINSGEYDIKELRNHGCKLEEIEPPGWFIEAQAKGEEKAQELAEAGVDLGDIPEYKPTPLAGQKKPVEPAPGQQP